MDYEITYLSDGLAELTGPEGTKTGIASSLSSRVFRSVDIGRLQSGRGWILDLSGGMTPWNLEGILEDQGQMVFFGPPVKGKTARPENLETQDLILLGRIMILAGEKNLPVQGFFSRGWMILEDRRVLLLPPELMDFIRRNQTEEVKESCWAPFNHPDRQGLEGLSFSLAVLTYRYLTGENPYSAPGDELAEEIRTQPVIPPLFRAPGLKKEFSEFVVANLDPREKPPGLVSWRPYLDQWEKDEIFVPLKEEEKEALEKQRAELESRRKTRIELKGFWRRKRTIILTAFIIAGILIAFLTAPVKEALAPPETMGMSPDEVVEAYYGSFKTLNQELMEDCIDKKAGRQDLKEVMNLFVTTRVRQGYEGSTGFMSAQEWTDRGRPLPDPGITVYGITNSQITRLEETRYQIVYEKWYPEVPEEENQSIEGVYPRGFRVRDTAVLEQQKKGNWLIVSLNRTIEDL